MKHVVLSILAAMMLSATTWAAESEGLRQQPNDMAAYLLEGTISQPKFSRPPLKSFQTDNRYLKFLECFSKLEYGIERGTCFPGHGVPPQKQAIVTRFQLFNKPIYLTFSFSE